jgi:hypothetical protein
LICTVHTVCTHHTICTGHYADNDLEIRAELENVLAKFKLDEVIREEGILDICFDPCFNFLITPHGDESDLRKSFKREEDKKGNKKDQNR